jgi:hypothetical protein
LPFSADRTWHYGYTWRASSCPFAPCAGNDAWSEAIVGSARIVAQF